MNSSRARAERAATQRRRDMATLEIRRWLGGPWERVSEVAPEILEGIAPSSDGVIDERILLAWGLSAGDLEYQRQLDPACPLAFRLSGQFRSEGVWQLTRAGALRMVERWLAA
jgi:hypothetical protein